MSFEASNVKAYHLATGGGHAISPAQRRHKLMTKLTCQNTQQSPGGCVITPHSWKKKKNLSSQHEAKIFFNTLVTNNVNTKARKKNPFSYLLLMRAFSTALKKNAPTQNQRNFKSIHQHLIFWISEHRTDKKPQRRMARCCVCMTGYDFIWLIFSI